MMYYEEKVIGGILMCRGRPDGVWEPVSPERMTERLVAAEKRLAEIETGMQDAAYEARTRDRQ